MQTIDRVIEQIAIAYTNAGTTWVRIRDIAETTGLTGQEIGDAIRELMDEDGFRAEPEPFGHRVTAWDRANAPVIGGEARHLICWE